MAIKKTLKKFRKTNHLSQRIESKDNEKFDKFDLMEAVRRPGGLDNPEIRWAYQKRILTMPIRWFKRLIRKLK